MKPVALSAFLYERQGGRCYLRISSQCRAAGGWIHHQNHCRRERRGWTWDHVIPLHIQKRLMKDASLKLLACRACNWEKGGSLPRPEHIALALALYQEFNALPHQVRGGADHGRASELAARYAEKFMLRADDLEAPSTVEQALAQGGIFVGPTTKIPCAEKAGRYQAAQLRAKADRAEAVGDHERARELRAQAWAIIDAQREGIKL